MTQVKHAVSHGQGNEIDRCSVVPVNLHGVYVERARIAEGDPIAAELALLGRIERRVAAGLEVRRHVRNRDRRHVDMEIAVVIGYTQGGFAGEVVGPGMIDTLTGGVEVKVQTVVVEVPLEGERVVDAHIGGRASKRDRHVLFGRIGATGVGHRRHVLDRDSQFVRRFSTVIVRHGQCDGVGAVIGKHMTGRGSRSGRRIVPVAKVPVEGVGIGRALVGEGTREGEGIAFVGRLIGAGIGARRYVLDEHIEERFDPPVRIDHVVVADSDSDRVLIVVGVDVASGQRARGRINGVGCSVAPVDLGYVRIRRSRVAERD